MAHYSKKAKHAFTLAETKRAGREKGPDRYFALPPTFSFRRYDAGAPWAIPKNGKPTVDSLFKNIRGVEEATWGDIIQAGGGRSHGTNSHYIPIEALSKDAKQRAWQIDMCENELFSLRVQGSVRLWGIVEPENGCFYVIWFDPNHQVYPV